MTENKSMDKKIDAQWILLRGLAREARHWGTFGEELNSALSKNGDEVRVEAIDIPGAGRYSEMTSPVTVRGITDFVHDKFLEIRERQRRNGERPAPRTYLVAVSLGGMIAARWMQRWPRELAGCVLVNTSFRGVSPILRRLKPRAIKHLARTLTLGDAFEREKEILRMISTRPARFNEIAREWAPFALDRPVSSVNFARQLIAAATYAPPAERPLCPILVLNSAGDRMVDPECSRQIAKRWDVALIEHPSAGHDLPLDDAPWMIEQLREFSLKV